MPSIPGSGGTIIRLCWQKPPYFGQIKQNQTIVSMYCIHLAHRRLTRRHSIIVSKSHSNTISSTCHVSCLEPRRGAAEEDRPLLCHILRVLLFLSSAFIFFLISPNIIVIWPDHDDVCSQNFSCTVVTTSHYPVRSFLKSERVIFIQAARSDLRDQTK